jgi:hypothetical protein
MNAILRRYPPTNCIDIASLSRVLITKPRIALRISLSAATNSTADLPPRPPRTRSPDRLRSVLGPSERIGRGAGVRRAPAWRRRPKSMSVAPTSPVAAVAPVTPVGPGPSRRTCGTGRTFAPVTPVEPMALVPLVAPVPSVALVAPVTGQPVGMTAVAPVAPVKASLLRPT